MQLVTLPCILIASRFLFIVPEKLFTVLFKLNRIGNKFKKIRINHEWRKTLMIKFCVVSDNNSNVGIQYNILLYCIGASLILYNRV